MDCLTPLVFFWVYPDLSNETNIRISHLQEGAVSDVLFFEVFVPVPFPSACTPVGMG